MTETIAEKIPEMSQPITRDLLIKKRGNMISVLYLEDGYTCFAIGWFFQLTQHMARLKITSTRFENYESLDIPVGEIFSVEDYRDN